MQHDVFIVTTAREIIRAWITSEASASGRLYTFLHAEKVGGILNKQGQMKGRPVGTRLIPGKYLGITSKQAFFYNRRPGTPDNARPLPEQSRPARRTDKVGDIIAMFKNEGQARQCMNSIQGKGVLFDKKWAAQTHEALAMIGNGHPHIILAECPEKNPWAALAKHGPY